MTYPPITRILPDPPVYTPPDITPTTARRFAYPIRATETGRIDAATGVEAGRQAIFALLSTNPGDLPLSRNYGIQLDANVPLQVAQLYPSEVEAALLRWHPDVNPENVEVIVEDEGTTVRARFNIIAT